MADEAGFSRLYGGILYPSDINQGKAHGARIGAWDDAASRGRSRALPPAGRGTGPLDWPDEPH